LPIYLVTPIVLVTAGTGVVIAVIFFVALKESAVQTIVKASSWIIRRITKNPVKQENWREKIQNALSSFSQVFKTFKAHPRYLIKPVFFAVIAWMFNLVVYLLIFYSLNFTSISLVDLATVYCIVTTVETLTAGFPVGAVEVTMINLFYLYGVPLAVAGAATTLTRLLTFWCQVPVGYPLVEWIGAKSLLKGNLPSEVIINLHCYQNKLQPHKIKLSG
jgi:uncharacterized protein (TIRG00374 family)